MLKLLHKLQPLLQQTDAEVDGAKEEVDGATAEVDGVKVDGDASKRRKSIPVRSVSFKLKLTSMPNVSSAHL